LKKNTLIAILIGVFAIVIFLVVATIISNEDRDELLSNVSEEETKFKEEYEVLNIAKTPDGREYPKVKIPSDNKIKYTSVAEIINIMENGGNAVVYFGESTCLYCRSAVQVLIDTAKTTDLEVIYYLQHDEVDIDDDYNKLMDMMGDYYLSVNEETDEKRITIPLVIFIADGNIVSSNIGTLFSQTDPLTPLDDSQIAGLSEIYLYGIKDVLGINFSD